MATTGFWPVRGYLKKVLEYADNPDKTMEKKFLDDDLYAALRYTENDDKTDERKYVSGINCSAAFAYQEMTAVKRKYGEHGKVIAYHGYQSFKTGEVTPEQAHEIGLETARRMWGRDFQVLVTTHLNTDNLHNHFVVNSVSFRDGHKYRNSIEQHRDLREISDTICKEHGLSVLTDAPFYGGQSRQAYWKHQRDGKPTHREQLKQDIEYCLQYSSNWDQFIQQLNTKGYYFDPVRVSVKADGWQRAVRLDRLGYPDEYLDEHLDKNAADPAFKYRYNNHRPGPAAQQDPQPHPARDRSPGPDREPPGPRRDHPADPVPEAANKAPPAHPARHPPPAEPSQDGAAGGIRAQAPGQGAAKTTISHL